MKGMTREELRAHCKKQIEMCEYLTHAEDLNDNKIYQEHKLILELLEQGSILDKIKAEIEQLRLHKAKFLTNDNKVCIDSQAVIDIIYKYKAESEDKE